MPELDLQAGPTAYMLFLQQRVRQILRQELMAIAAEHVDRVVEEALRDLEMTIRENFLPESQRRFVDVVVRRKPNG